MGLADMRNKLRGKDPETQRLIILLHVFLFTMLAAMINKKRRTLKAT
jgi:hypothetical protein